jgi:hypothetical protein
LLVAAYAAAFRLAEAPETRTHVAVVQKRSAKRAVLAEARKLGAICRAHLPASDSRRAALGLHVRPAGASARSPRPAPVTAPLVRVVRSAGGVATLALRDAATPFGKAKPRHVLGALLSFEVTPVGTGQPAGLGEGPGNAFCALVTGTTYRLPLPPGTQGMVLWVRARWVNERGMGGPSGPVGHAVISA